MSRTKIGRINQACFFMMGVQPWQRAFLGRTYRNGLVKKTLESHIIVMLNWKWQGMVILDNQLRECIPRRPMLCLIIRKTFICNKIDKIHPWFSFYLSWNSVTQVLCNLIDSETGRQMCHWKYLLCGKGTKTKSHQSSKSNNQTQTASLSVDWV